MKIKDLSIAILLRKAHLCRGFSWNGYCSYYAELWDNLFLDIREDTREVTVRDHADEEKATFFLSKHDFALFWKRARHQ